MKPIPCIAALALAAAWPATAATLFLPGTGTDNGGNVLPGGSPDPHYVVTGPGAAGGPAVVYSAPNLWPDWVPNGAASAWVGFSDNSDTRPYGFYTYTLSFDLGGQGNVSNAVLSGRWAADQAGKILLNGTDTAVQVFDGNWYGPLHPQLNPFVVHGGFVAGVNTLSFVVPEFDGFDGLRVEPMTLVTAVPEPAARPLLLAGLAPLLMALRRRGGS